MTVPARLATAALVAAFTVLGLWANDFLGLGHHASAPRILAVLVSAPLLGGALAQRVIAEARDCSVLLLAAAALAGFLGALELSPPFQMRGAGLAFAFAVSTAAAIPATYYKKRRAAGRARPD